MEPTPEAAAPPKPSWPLIVLAAFSFIPVFGFFIGSAAVTWALLSDRPRARLAIGLGATGSLLNVAGMFLLVSMVGRSDVLQDAQVQLVRQDLARLVVAIEEFQDRNGRYPATLQALVGPLHVGQLNIYDHTRGLFRTRPYEYHPDHTSGTYDLFSPGPDGVAATVDDIRPDVSDSLNAPGYKPAS